MFKRIEGEIWPKSLQRQTNGTYTLIFEQNNKTYKQENISLCTSGTYIHDTGNDSDTRYYNIHFEVNVDFNSPHEIK